MRLKLLSEDAIRSSKILEKLTAHAAHALEVYAPTPLSRILGVSFECAVDFQMGYLAVPPGTFVALRAKALSEASFHLIERFEFDREQLRMWLHAPTPLGPTPHELLSKHGVGRVPPSDLPDDARA